MWHAAPCNRLGRQKVKLHHLNVAGAQRPLELQPRAALQQAGELHHP